MTKHQLMLSFSCYSINDRTIQGFKIQGCFFLSHEEERGGSQAENMKGSDENM